MRVDTRMAAVPTAAPQRPAAAGTRFSLGGRSAASATGAARAAVPPSTMDAILALQGQAAHPDERRRRSARQGHDMLDALDRLKAALLSGRVAASELQAIAGRLAERADASGDPGLDEVVAHIRLRAEVEMAKLKRDRSA